jgi:hypothetical protein
MTILFQASAGRGCVRCKSGSDGVATRPIIWDCGRDHGAVIGLVVGLFTYAPTAPFAAAELGLPSAIVGGTARVRGRCSRDVGLTVALGRPLTAEIIASFTLAKR